MKIITRLKNDANIAEYKASCLILSTPFSCYSDSVYQKNLENIVTEIHNLQKEVAFLIDKIVDQSEISILYSFLDSYEKNNIDYFIFSDMSIYNYFAERKLSNKLIYSASTLVCSNEECLMYAEMGVKVIVSKELSLDELYNIKTKNVVLYAYGYLEMFYSKRKLINSYFQYTNKQRTIDSSFEIVETTRDAIYPIIENKTGTYIFNEFPYILFKELMNLSNMHMIYINGYLIDEEKILKVIEIYNKALSTQFDDTYLEELIAVSSNVTTGFLYKKPLILKENE